MQNIYELTNGYNIYDANCSDEINFRTFSLHSFSASFDSISTNWMAFVRIGSSTRNGVRVDTSEYLYKKKELKKNNIEFKFF